MDTPGPIVVGGVGGSGTRVVAAMLLAAGTYLGDDLNPALDNLWFTLLCKRPAWLRQARRSDPTAIARHLDILGRALQGERLPAADLRLAAEAAFEVSESGHNHLGHGRGGWPFLRLASMVDSTGPDPARHIAWGWKEPNSHRYLAELALVFPTLRYVHVLRHGLDIAYGNNQQQAYLWASDFGLPAPPLDGCPPALALRYWVAANRCAIDQGTEVLGERFVLVRHEALCDQPSAQAHRLLSALGLPTDAGLVARLAALPRPQSGRGRHRFEDLSEHATNDLAAIEELGYEVDTATDREAEVTQPTCRSTEHGTTGPGQAPE